MNQKIELLSPAKNLECGIVAVNCGADAVYIGAPKFGARAVAGNTLHDIEKLINYAHPFGVKIFATLNTILYDNELEEAQKLIHQLYNIGCDALIVQDLGILKLDIPPIALHASTQTDNRTVEKVQFLQKCGFERIVLARETPLELIEKIYKQTQAELEVFVHGALCVSYSGQCYMSYANCGRSANKGECAQYCRLPYSLQDANGNILLKNKHLLSLKDLNRANFLEDLINAGVMSFKIEGRMKEANYVKNITAFYRKKLDAILEHQPERKRSSFGKSTFFFNPIAEKSFHRGNTDYFLFERSKNMVQLATPKSLGEYIGVVSQTQRKSIEIDTKIPLHNGDGLCFINSKNEFSGFRINQQEGKSVLFNEAHNLKKGDKVFRNYDHEFEKQLQTKSAERKIAINFLLSENDEGVCLAATAESGISVSQSFKCEKQLAEKPQQAENTIKTQLSKLGDTIFSANRVDINFAHTYFFPSSQISFWRKELINKLLDKLLDTNKPQPIERHISAPKTAENTSFMDNISNKNAANFYLENGTKNIAWAFELEKYPKAVLMQCKYCIKYELGWCSKQKNNNVPKHKEPLFLSYNKKLFKLKFDCKKCEMWIESCE